LGTLQTARQAVYKGAEPHDGQALHKQLRYKTLHNDGPRSGSQEAGGMFTRKPRKRKGTVNIGPRGRGKRSCKTLGTQSCVRMRPGGEVNVPKSRGNLLDIGCGTPFGAIWVKLAAAAQGRSSQLGTPRDKRPGRSKPSGSRSLRNNLARNAGTSTCDRQGEACSHQRGAIPRPKAGGRCVEERRDDNAES
jgi:hypothetical protein